MAFSDDVAQAGSDVNKAGDKAAEGTAKAQASVDVAGDAVGVVTGAVSMAVGAVVDAVSVIGSLIPATLYCITPPNIGVVPFDFNPETITMSRSSSTGGMSRPQRPDATALAGGAKTSGTSGTYTRQVKASQIKLADVIMEGPFTKLRCDTLLTWMNPSTGLLAQFAAAGSNFSTAPAPLTFQWGPPMIGFMYDVTISSCSITYERFTPAGIPTRAKVSITMNEVPSKLGSLPTNPTSGGIPGRRTHTVAHGENLQSIAMEKYGTPGIWRRIAEVNKINDPTRVRPGTTIYLPNPDELTARRS
ncbi:LysM peptidoglycan-binding domain-containing protein [Actinophytocola sp.]|uniref:LysM peptidoglycan-binding domain-containing protein n=1 Tax=Actinophytocola sp. TaxID=1872138 RepID=UPI002D7E6A8F|nr:LysM peptidoglycan-binding domain-containing protein [Actinophytocola sp.]HET9141319.1 LysM peptidoglycan-binding domain-containing protein [Actinophytocola sp.]